MELHDGTTESVVRNWRETASEELVVGLLESAGPRRPMIIAVDGRSGSGKSTLAAMLVRESGASLIATDDLAWWAPMFEWAEMAIEGVLRPIRDGRGCDFVPPAWIERGRGGAITVPPDAGVVVIEGVGASQQAFEGLIDISIWVQSDYRVARRLGIARDIASGVNGDAKESEAFWDQWMESENVFFETDRPWDRADLIVMGTSHLPSSVPMVRVAAAE